MKTVNLYRLAELIIAAQAKNLALGHPAVLEEALKEALYQVEFIDVGGGCAPTRVSAQNSSASALSTQVGGDHYKGDKIQHVEFCQLNGLTWCESAAMKYLMRHRKKNKVQDVDKAIHYCLLLRQIEYPQAAPFDLQAK